MAKEINKSTPKKVVLTKGTKKNVQIKFKKPNLDLSGINWMKVLKVSAIVVAVVVGFGLIDLLVQYLNNDYSIAVVDGQRITKNEYHKAMEKMYGSTTANGLIEESIIKQEAKKADIKVSKDEVDKKINELIQSVGGQEAYEIALKTSNLTDAYLREQIELDILATKLLTPQIEYTDDTLKEFFDQYSSIMFPEEAKALEEGEKLNFEEFKSKVEDIYIQQEVERLKTTWIADRESEYKIQNNATEKPKYGVFTTTSNILKNLFNKANDNTAK